MTTRSKTWDVSGRLIMLVGVGLAIWAVDSFVIGPPNVNELDIIDLLLSVVIALTLVMISLRLRRRRSPWKPLFLGFGMSVFLCVLALLKAVQDFNGK